MLKKLASFIGLNILTQILWAIFMIIVMKVYAHPVNVVGFCWMWLLGTPFVFITTLSIHRRYKNKT